MQHILGHKILEYDVDERGIIIDEREYSKHRKDLSDDVTAYKVGMCSELCVEGTTGPIMHFRASDSTEDNIYFINSRKDGKRTILTFDVSTKTINASVV